MAPPRNPNRQVARKSAPRAGVEVNAPTVRTEIRTDLEQFGTIDFSEPIERPHGARQVQTTDDTATAFFDIPLSDLVAFDNITRGRFARHQISEPFEIAGLWWVLGIESKAQFNSSRSQICAHLFCISLQHRLSATRVRSFPLRWKIHRGEKVFCAETGQAFDDLDGLIQVPGTFIFSMVTGTITGTSNVVEFGGHPLVLHGADVQPICGMVLGSVSNNDMLRLGGDLIALTVKFLGNPPLRVRVVESGQDGDDGDANNQAGSADDGGGKKHAGSESGRGRRGRAGKKSKTG